MNGKRIQKQALVALQAFDRVDPNVQWTAVLVSEALGFSLSMTMVYKEAQECRYRYQAYAPIGCWPDG